jgi:deoxyribonuclease-4
MAGKGHELCSTLGMLSELLGKVGKNVGVCFDTCHAHDAGMDLADLETLVKRIERSIGFDRLHVLHLNGSLNERGKKKDRHSNLLDANNKIPSRVLRDFAQYPKFKNIPVIIETFQNEVTLVKDMEYMKMKSRFSQLKVNG